MLNGIKDPIVVLSPGWRVLESNDAFAYMCGTPKEALKGINYTELLSLSSIDKAISTSFTQASIETARINQDGRNYEATVTPALEDGAVSMLVVVLKDITYFVHLEEELIKKNQHLMVSNALASTFIDSEDMSGIFEELLLKSLAITEMSIGMIIMLESDETRLESSRGMSIALKNAVESGRLDGFIKKLFLSDAPMEVLESLEDGMPRDLWIDGIRFCVSIPLRSHGESLGVLVLASRLEVTLDFDLASLLSVTGYIISMLSDKIRLFNEAKKLSITDALTGLYNARHFYEELEREVERSQRYGESFSIILCDIDNFKAVNDSCGHQAGDEVLCSVADVLASTARVTDTVARYGGEEFIVILPETAKDKAAALAERIRVAIDSSDFLPNEGGLKVSISCGVASYPDDSDNSKTLLYCSDMAMYKAKEFGKNRVVCFEKETK